MPIDTEQKLKTRQPIVVVVGHVDHGKTTLLDYIRKTGVAEKEAGGITQAVGAYEVEVPQEPKSRESGANGGTPHDVRAIGSETQARRSDSAQTRRITFIDTPGHEAFSKMRSRGAEVADVAILVVAGDEGVKPQTLEAIKTLESSKTPYVVAITKMDKPGADIEKVKADLAANNVSVEGYGGNISFHGVSAKTGEGIDNLLELVILTAELEHLGYNPDATPKGYVLEAKMNKNRGTEATIILKDGVLRRGDDVATPSAKGKAKILENFLGKAVEELEAGEPALVLGFEGVPQVGEEFTARDISAIKSRGAGMIPNGKEAEKDKNALCLILKASDQGSLEALRDIITYLDPTKPLKLVSIGVGEVGDNDVKLAISTDSSIIGFKTKVDKAAARLAETHKIKIITSEIIYDLVKAVQDFFIDLDKKTSLGELEVLAIFNQEKLSKQVVGGKVTHGSFRNRSVVQIKRPSSADATAGKDEQIVGQGRVTNLQTAKKDANSVGEGNEAGVMISSDVPIAVGDHLIINE